VSEKSVHHCLKGGWGVRESEEHNQRFEQSSVSSEGGLVLISFFDSNIIISPT
ncbi:hypothetical protein SERLA73DRAFT_33629, partial [Serpula lacrymans var. lacrymans S7.3]